jgi:hypothetical protein
MSNISASFALQTLDGTNNNTVGISRGYSFTATSYTGTVFEQLNVAANSTDVAFAVPSTPNKVLCLENSGTVDLLYRINNNTGTQLTVLAGGFMLVTTSTPITAIYLSNQSTTTAGQIKIFVGG